MSAFRDSSHVAEVVGGFFRHESESDWKTSFFGGSGIVLAYKLHDPDVRIVLDARAKPEHGKAFAIFVNDPNAPAPTTEFSLSADDFDRLYRGEIQPMAMLTSGQLKTAGDVALAMRLLPAFARSIPHYKQYRETH